MAARNGRSLQGDDEFRPRSAARYVPIVTPEPGKPRVYWLLNERIVFIDLVYDRDSKRTIPAEWVDLTQRAGEFNQRYTKPKQFPFCAALPCDSPQRCIVRLSAACLLAYPPLMQLHTARNMRGACLKVWRQGTTNRSGICAQLVQGKPAPASLPGRLDLLGILSNIFSGERDDLADLSEDQQAQ